MASVELTSIAPPGWDALWERNPRATLFLHPRWMRFLEKAFPEQQCRYLVATADGKLAGLIPLTRSRRYIFSQFLSLPFGAHGGPLLEPDADPAIAGDLAHAFRRLARPWTLRFEMSLFNPGSELRRAMTPALGDSFQDFKTHLVDLTAGEERLWNRDYKKETRECVRFAERAQVQVEVDNSPDAMKTLHQFHARQGTGWTGVAPYSLKVIQAVIEEFGEDARLYLARVGGEPVAGCLCLGHGNREVHAWVSGATPQARESRAFHLLIHTAIMDSSKRGVGVWHFGGSGGIKGVEFFKESFGAVPYPVLRCFYLARWFRRLRSRPEWDR